MNPPGSGTVPACAGQAAASPAAALGRLGIVPVAVIDDVGDAAPLTEALLAGGIGGAEVTLRTPAALGALAVMARYPGFVAGAGTVLDAWQVAAAADAGARFAVSPGFDPDVVDACQNRSLPVLPGAVTATEIQRVRRAGLRACKFFPAEASGGLHALSALAAPFPDMRFVPTGGIGPANAGDYLAAPYVLAVGGTWMVTRELIAGRYWDRIRALAAQAAALAAERPAR
ncbi:MAG: bifunctional 4-hydroxy-2-oxoglutarate aldolase/2-dehydro-3-deoxy-phosphogluconate aldolase [Acidobacteria bacterium]|nr:bifunctional 4-hydroxy-2-oxoglutarate aldolase/2-dehydro-3-deoxy-phosphogluconate aldolase [Acidobacteriota bacterium]